jgi:hypothetical protein
MPLRYRVHLGEPLPVEHRSLLRDHADDGRGVDVAEELERQVDHTVKRAHKHTRTQV